MFIKLGIIAGILILGGVMFSTEIENLFPTTSATVTDSLKDDVSDLETKTADSAEKRIDESIDDIVDKTSSKLKSEINEAGDRITSEISEIKDSSQQIINEEISDFNPLDFLQNIFTDNSESQSSEPSILTSSSNTSPSPSSNHLPIIYETLSLSTKQISDNNILLQYSDSSGNTNNAVVKIRTDQKEIFSGTFFTSIFETTVNDAANIPYFVDLIVEHEDYGTVTSSVFNPGDASDSKIYGVFVQS